MIKIFLKKEKTWTKEKENFWLNINFYWKFTVCFLFAVILFSSFFGYYLFMQINKEPVLSLSGTSPKVETVKKERMEKVLEYFSIRKQKSNQILNYPAPVSDPSL